MRYECEFVHSSRPDEMKMRVSGKNTDDNNDDDKKYGLGFCSVCANIDMENGETNMLICYMLPSEAAKECVSVENHKNRKRNNEQSKRADNDNAHTC